MAQGTRRTSLFDLTTRELSPEHKRVFRIYEVSYTLIDLFAGLAFVVGSIMFFSRAWQDAGTWLFLLGSILFVVSPTVRFLRELHLTRLPVPGELPGGDR